MTAVKRLFGWATCLAAYLSVALPVAAGQEALNVPDPEKPGQLLAIERVIAPTEERVVALGKALKIVGLASEDERFKKFSDASLRETAQFFIQTSMVQKVDVNRVILYNPIADLFILLWKRPDGVRAGVALRNKTKEVTLATEHEERALLQYKVPAIGMMKLALELLRYEGPDDVRPEWDLFIAQASKSEAKQVVEAFEHASSRIEYAQSNPCRSAVASRLFGELTLTKGASTHPPGIVEALSLAFVDRLSDGPLKPTGRWRLVYADTLTFRHFLEVDILYEGSENPCRVEAARWIYAY